MITFSGHKLIDFVDTFVTFVDL